MIRRTGKNQEPFPSENGHGRYIIPTTIDTLDPQMEWRRLSERYGQMSDDELLALARHSSELTDVAQQSLAGEISRRGLKVQPEEPPAPQSPATTDSSYAEDRELTCTHSPS